MAEQSPRADRTPGAPRRDHRLLIVDDNAAIHEDFRKILTGEGDTESFDDLESSLFGDAPRETRPPRKFALDSAYQGPEGLECAQRALAAAEPFSVAFVDIRMPPGWDGVETARRLLQLDEALQIVVCSAYSDYSWRDMSVMLGESDRWVVLKKPFDPIEIRQLTHALVTKHELAQTHREHLQHLASEVRRRTADLEQANQRLRDEIAERQRVEAQLRQKQRLEALGRLAAGIGHEINNPLTFLIGNIDFVREQLIAHGGALPEDARRGILQDLEDARVGADRVERIVKEMRHFSHPENEELAPVDLRAVIELASKMVANSIRPRARLVKRLEPVPAVLAVQSRLEQVFVNVLTNAADAVPAGRAKEHEIRVSLSLDPEDSKTVVAEVSDTGRGIAAEDVERVFDPFFTRKGVGQGTGLGLSICHSIVTAFDGEIQLRSKPGRGTVVRIALPALREARPASIGGFAPPPPPSRAAPGNPSTAAARAGTRAGAEASRKPRVLVVDDEPLVAATIGRMISLTCDVAVRNSGREALEVLKTEEFDLVLCDLMMDDVTGMELYELLRAERPGYERRLVFVTGGAFTDDARQFLESVPNERLDKPLSYESLEALLRRIG